MKRALIALWAFWVVVGCSSGQGPRPVDYTSLRTAPSGPVVGYANDYGSHSYVGIPYAQPPVGSLRWRAPRPHPTWEEPLEAVEFGSSCVQFASAMGGDLSEDPGTLVGSEDCLFLNVYAPKLASAAAASAESRPVMFWIHGGGNTIGTSSFYDGGRLAAEENVVVVSINYRLGPLGWFRHPSIAAHASPAEQSGNFALLDLIGALGWVRDHIASFGGDPGNVTIFGESAGGQNVLMLMTSPLAKGLFHRAISQSGGTWTDTVARAENAIDDPEPGHEKSSAEIAIGLRLAHHGAANRDEAKAQLAALSPTAQAGFLRETSAVDLMRRYDDRGIGMYSLPKPFPDGVALPQDGIRGGLSRPDGHADVPLLLGSNKDEDKLFLYFDPEFVDLWFGLYPRLLDENRYQLSAEYLSRHWKAHGVDELAQSLAAQHPSKVFAYRFDWDEEPTVVGKDLGSLFGAAHGFEIPFVFGHWNLGPTGRILFTDENEPGREELSRMMRSYWVQFATDGAPGQGREGDLTAWKAWDPSAGGRTWMRLDTPEAGGPQMQTSQETRAAIAEELGSDPRLEGDLRCAVATDLAQRWEDFDTTKLEEWGCESAAESN